MGANKIPSVMASTILAELRKKYSIPDYIKLLVLEAYERACYLRPGCVAVSEFLFKAGICLSILPSLL